VASLFNEIREDLPCFIQGHSMGCLAAMAFLINNPHLKITGVIAGSPFWGFGEKVDWVQRLSVKILSVTLEELPLNGGGS